MSSNRSKRRRALAAEAEGALPAFEIVRPPLVSHALPPLRGRRGRLPARKADDAPATRAARHAAPAADARRAAAAPAVTAAPALLAPPVTPRTTHGRDDAVTPPLRKFLDGRASRALPLGSRGKNKARGESVGNRSRGLLGPQGAATPRSLLAGHGRPVSRVLQAARNRHALQRAAETGEVMPSRSVANRNPTNPCRTPQPSTPAPYLPEQQNQGLCDVSSPGDQGVTERRLTEHLSELRRDALAIVEYADRLEAAVARVASAGGDL